MPSNLTSCKLQLHLKTFAFQSCKDNIVFSKLYLLKSKKLLYTSSKSSFFLSPLCIRFSFSSGHLSQTLIQGNCVKSLWRISFSLLPADTWSTSVFLWCSVVWVLHYIQQLTVLPGYRYIIPLQLFSVQQLWQACPSSSALSAPAPSEVWDAAAGLFIKTHMLTPWQVSAGFSCSFKSTPSFSLPFPSFSLSTLQTHHARSASQIFPEMLILKNRWFDLNTVSKPSTFPLLTQLLFLLIVTIRYFLA